MKHCSSTRSFTARLKKNLLELLQPINSIAHLFQWFLSLLFSSFESILKLMENVFIFLLIYEQNDLKLFVLCVVFFPDNIFSQDHYQWREEKQSTFSMQLRRKHFSLGVAERNAFLINFPQPVYFCQGFSHPPGIFRHVGYSAVAEYLPLGQSAPLCLSKLKWHYHPHEKLTLPPATTCHFNMPAS